MASCAMPQPVSGKALAVDPNELFVKLSQRHRFVWIKRRVGGDEVDAVRDLADPKQPNPSAASRSRARAIGIIRAVSWPGRSSDSLRPTGRARMASSSRG